MILRCCNKHKEICLEYLLENPVFNLFMIGDIINYGFDSSFQTVFIDIDSRIRAIYLVFYDNLIIQSYEKKIDHSFIDVLMHEYKIKMVSGNKDIVDLIELNDFDNHDCVLAKNQKYNNMDLSMVKKLSLEKVDEFAKVRKAIFNIDNTDILATDIVKKSGRSFYIEENKEVVSIASSSAECENLAMIVSVGTKENYRNKGYATKVVAKLCNELLSENKMPILFYNNVKAGNIYHNLGFEDCGIWALRKKRG